MAADKSQYVMHARALKALHLADFLSRKGISVAVARAFDDARRRAAEDGAKVRVASDETWDVVFAILERRELGNREDADAAEAAMFAR